MSNSPTLVRIAVPVLGAALLLFLPGVGAQERPAADAERSTRLLTQSAVIMPYLLNFSADGNYLISSHATDEGELIQMRIWEVASGLEVGRRDEFCSAMSSDRRRCLTVDAHGTLRLVSIPQGDELSRFELPAGDRIRVVAGNGLVGLTQRRRDDGTHGVINLEAGEEALRINLGIQSRLRAMVLSQTGEVLFGVDAESNVRAWNIRSQAAPMTLQKRAGVDRLALSPDGRLLAGGARDRNVPAGAKSGFTYLWDTETGAIVRTLNAGEEPISIVFSQSGKLVLVSDRDNFARLWHVPSGRVIREFETSGYTPAIAIAPGGRSLATATSSHDLFGDAIRMWDVRQGKEVQQFTGRVMPVVSASFTSEPSVFVTAGGSIRVWDLTRGEEAFRIADKEQGLMSLVVSANGRYLAATAKRGKAQVWDLKTRSRLEMEAEGGSRVIALSLDGRLFASARGNRLTVRGVPGGQVIQMITAPASISALVFASGDRRLLGATEKGVFLWDLATGQVLHQMPSEARLDFSVIAATADGPRALISLGGRGVVVWNLQTGREERRLLETTNRVRGLALSLDGRHALIWAQRTGGTVLVDLDTGQQRHQLRGILYGTGMQFSSDGRFVTTQSIDGGTLIWDVASGRELARLVSFNDGTWAVVDDRGRYDASNAGDVEGMHWVVGLQPIALSQLKERYYDPGLLAKKLGLSDQQVRNVQGLSDPTLFPAIDASFKDPSEPRLSIHLTNRGGGIGRVIVLVNGKEREADARGPGANPNQAEMDIELDLTGDPRLIPGANNVVEVRAYNQEGYLSSRGQVVDFTVSEGEVSKPTLWAIVAGVSDYEGDSLDLQYAGKDAENFATAIRLGAQRLFGADRVRMRLLSTMSGDPAALPSKQNLEQAFLAAEAAKSTDILVVYLAGHGVSFGEEYYYLTREARSSELADTAIRERVAISSAELVEWIKATPALKQVMVLDTCAAGQLVPSLVDRREISTDQILAIERLKDRTGFHVLMGSAADAVSYEATQYEQGLLTYALLQGMRGPALRAGEFVDVNALFQYAADEVPKLARNVGGIQRPRIAAPEGTSFDVGQLVMADRQTIPLATAKPLVLQPVFLSAETLFDQLQLGTKVRRELRAMSFEATAGGRPLPVVYVSADELAGGIRPTGTYTTTGDSVTVTVVLARDGEVLRNVPVTGSASDVAALAASMATRIISVAGEF